MSYYGDDFAIGMAILLFPMIFLFAIGFVFYIFNAIGLYGISKKRGYKNAWLAFIPVVNSYVLGGIADNINYCNMKKSNNRIWLLSLSIASTVGGFMTIIPSMQFLFSVLADPYAINGSSIYGLLGSTMTISLLISLISIAFAVISYICQYKIYADYAPSNAALYLVLSILLGIGCFFIFAIRNKPSSSLYFAAQRNNPNGGNPYQPPTNGGYQAQQPINNFEQQNQNYQQPNQNYQQAPPVNQNYQQTPPVNQQPIEPQTIETTSPSQNSDNQNQ